MWRKLVGIAAFAQLRAVLASYSMWHGIDPMPVVCPVLEPPFPLPANMTLAEWPTKQEFGIVIVPDKFGLNKDAPHVVTFLRTKKTAVTIDFVITDGNGSKIMTKSVKLSAAATGKTTGCACTGKNTGVTTGTYGATYGTKCSEWDATNCAKWYASAPPGPWCCQAWCYVPATCEDAYVSSTAGLYFSYAGACGSKEAANCSYSSPTPPATPRPAPAPPTTPPPTFAGACNCMGVSPELLHSGRRRAASSNTVAWSQDYGKSCYAWDAKSCAEYWPSIARDDWCCQSWCYVDSICSTATPSWILPGYYFSYAACPDSQSECNYINATNQCVGPTANNLCGSSRRLESDSDSESESESESESRRLDSEYRRRRASSSSRRRAATSPRRRSDPSRRRAEEAPRRRAAAVPQRRRAPPPPSPQQEADSRRRRSPPPPPAGTPPSPTSRRRQSASTPATSVSSPRRRSSTSSSTPRRRGRSDSGYSSDSTPRRRSSYGSSDIRRRDTSYGYSSKPNLQNNYHGSVPQQTSYGYSGSGPKKNSKVPMMMAGGAGLAAGAIVGAGSYYAYTQMKNGNWQGHYEDQSWCRVNADPSRTMLCYDCQQYTGSLSKCEILDDCYKQNAGCGYEMPGDTLRDDVMVAGFVPSAHPSPWTVTITKITGTGYAQADICPKQQADDGAVDVTWMKASSVNLGLYMTLTEMDALDVPGLVVDSGVASSGHHVSLGFSHILFVFVFILGRFVGRRA